MFIYAIIQPMQQIIEFVITEILTPRILSVVLGVAVLVVLVISGMLIYHWRRYTDREKSVKIAGLIYGAGHLILLAVAIVALLNYSAAV